jgi:hypothetical protein
VTVPTTAGASPAAAEAPHLQQANAQPTSQRPVPLSELHSAPLPATQQTLSDYDNYIAARTTTWKAAMTRGNAPAG